MRATSKTAVWQPSQEVIDQSIANRLMQMTGHESFDAFYQFSVDQPDQYWALINQHFGVVWDRPYERFSDFSAGIESPKWFLGGKLNWVNTVLRWAQDPRTADKAAICANSELGQAREVTYAQLARMVRQCAKGLQQLGVQRGDRVGLLMDNGVEANVSFMAISYIGAVAVPLFTGFGADAIIARLGSCEARFLLATTGFRRRAKFVDARQAIEQALESLPKIEHVVWKETEPGQLKDTDTGWQTLLAHGEIESAAQSMNPDDLFMIVYTSGTTGKPKGPVHCHGGFPLRIVSDAAINFNLSHESIFLWPADMGWIAGPIVSLGALLHGSTLVLYDGAPDYPDWSRTATLVEQYGVTTLGASPTLIRALAANEKQARVADLRSVKLLITAGEAIDPEHFTWFQEHVGGGRCPLINYTGGTEISGGLIGSVSVKPIAPGSFNAVCMAIDVQIADATGEPVVDQIGELTITQPFIGMTTTFFNDHERYLDSYWRTIPGRWVHGDLVYKSHEGYYYSRGRSDDTIKMAGKRLGPAEIEEILIDLPEIVDVAAIGVPDPEKGQKLIVFYTTPVELEHDVKKMAQTIEQRIEQRMGKPFRPSEIYHVQALPKTRSQKIMRRIIRNIYTNEPIGDLSALDNPIAVQGLKALFASS